jgi:hypothetical protein
MGMPLIDRDQALIVRVFPDGELRAGGAPGLHGFLVGSLFRGEPFEKIEDQGFYGFGQLDHFIGNARKKEPPLMLAALHMNVRVCERES